MKRRSVGGRGLSRLVLWLTLPALATAGAVAASVPAQAATASNCAIGYRPLGAWPTVGTAPSFLAEVAVTNVGVATSTGWGAQVQLVPGVKVDQVWNAANLGLVDKSWAFANYPFNGTVAPGQSMSFIFIGSKSDASLSELPISAACTMTILGQ